MATLVLTKIKPLKLSDSVNRLAVFGAFAAGQRGAARLRTAAPSQGLTGAAKVFVFNLEDRTFSNEVEEVDDEGNEMP